MLDFASNAEKSILIADYFMATVKTFSR